MNGAQRMGHRIAGMSGARRMAHGIAGASRTQHAEWLV